MKICTKCGITKPLEEFHWANKGKTYKRGDCRICCLIKHNAHKKKYPEKTKLNHRYAVVKHKYGISREQLDGMLQDVNFKCPICNCQINQFAAIDHDHSCCNRNGSCGACVNGVLCMQCNAGLGYLKDSPELLKNALAYLERVRSLNS